MNMINLIFDLDGTLIDSRQRLYRLFQRLVPESKLSFESYWELKRDQVSNEIILASEFGYDAVAIKSFVANWMDLIEEPDYLALDTLIPCIQDSLDKLREDASVHVCTARQHRTLVVGQLSRLGLLGYFDSVMVTEQRRSKEELIENLPNLGPSDWIIGDTGKDIQVGQALGLNTCAVLSGFMNEERLKAYNPRLILPTAADFYVS